MKPSKIPRLYELHLPLTLRVLFEMSLFFPSVLAQRLIAGC